MSRKKSLVANAIDNPTEILDLVDQNDEIIGSITRDEVLSLEATGRGFARAVGIFLVNDEGQLWVPRRSLTKKLAPGGIDFSAGEHVTSGESYEAAALRGIQEELHFQPNTAKLFYVGKLGPFKGMPYFHAIYTYATNDVPNFNTGDYMSFEWLMPPEVTAKLKQGEPAKEIILPSVQLLMAAKKEEA